MTDYSLGITTTHKMVSVSDAHSEIIINSKIAYVPSDNFPPHKALEYILLYHPHLVNQALNNPYIMSAGDLSDIRALYQQHDIREALDYMDSDHSRATRTVFKCAENDKKAALSQDRFYLLINKDPQ